MAIDFLPNPDPCGFGCAAARQKFLFCPPVFLDRYQRRRVYPASISGGKR